MVRIRLRRVGAKKQPSYRIVVIKSEAPATGRPIESIGHFNPRTEPETFEIQENRAIHWLGVGAQPSEAVLRLLKKSGIWAKFQAISAGEEVEVVDEVIPVAVNDAEIVADEEE